MNHRRRRNRSDFVFARCCFFCHHFIYILSLVESFVVAFIMLSLYCCWLFGVAIHLYTYTVFFFCLSLHFAHQQYLFILFAIVLTPFLLRSLITQYIIIVYCFAAARLNFNFILYIVFVVVAGLCHRRGICSFFSPSVSLSRTLLNCVNIEFL